jgi:8-oxo-dGTP pyrophosphatase MutT (NUDIX family)
MQVVRNIGYVKEQQRRGRRFTVIGFVGLAAAFVLVLWQQQFPMLILIAYALMLFGFIFFNIGLQTMGKFLSNERKKRADQQIDRALERLNDRYTVIHYAQLGKRVVDHIVVHTGGVLVLTVREVGGKIIVNDRRWRRGGNPLGRLFNYSGPQLGNPSLDNELAVAATREALEEAGLADRVEGAIVFTSPLAEVSGSAPIDVLGIDELLDHVRTLANDRERPPLTAKERLAIIETLSQGTEFEQATPRAERRKRAA